MADLVWREGYWFYDIDYLAYRHRRAGHYDPSVIPGPETIDVTLPTDIDMSGLVRLLEESGYIKPRLDERLRTEDLKITHRLLDIMERKLPEWRDT